MEPVRAKKESQLEDGTDTIDETTENKQDTKSAEMTAVGMYSGDGRLSYREERRVPTTVRTIWAQLGEKNQGAIAQRD